MVSESAPEHLGEQRGLVEGVEVSEVHPAAPGSTCPSVIVHPPKIQRDGQPMAEQTLQLPAEQVAGSGVQQQDSGPLQVDPLLCVTSA
ncbi:hypothetical protein [Streptomyces sp. NBC_01264]|uniref:hypothetical protein n=1 Tax=Streptomyces sp. NBC_01264 TaxID=2903804 RepID=UPI0022555919|nr:hypothetical protein [Streptomyces sp. NBC_01264]MCX4775622.1 hypothetical protein [Streptomyces sp. NBC_01264]